MRLIPLATLLLALPGFSDVIVVDASGGAGADFLEVQLAVDAAASGDTLLVRPGTYAGLEVDGRALVVIADGSPKPRLSFVDVRGLSPLQEFVLRGFRIGADAAQPPASWIELEDNAGPVWIESCNVGGVVQSAGAPAVLGSRVSDSGHVVFIDCVVRADGSSPANASGGDALWVAGSDVSLFDSALYAAGAAGDVPGGQGGSALRLGDGQLWMSNTDLRGGAGGAGDYEPVLETCLAPAGNGGDALVVENSSAVVREVASVLVGGVGGEGGGCPSGFSGQSISGTPDFFAQFPGFPRSLHVNSPVREGESLVFELTGTPGDYGFIAVSLKPSPLWLEGLHGVLLSPLTLSTLLYAGTLHPTTPDLEITAPQVKPPFETLDFFAQAIFVNPLNAEVYLGSGSHITLLDGQF